MSEHPEAGLLDEYVFGTLDRPDALRVAEHLETCAACRRECEELRSVIDLLPLALPPSPAPAALRNRILAAVDAPRARVSAVAVARGFAAALLIALAGDVFFAIRFAPGHPVVAVATPTPTRTATAAIPRARATVGPAFVSHAASTTRPLPNPRSLRAPSAASSAAARSAAAARERAARDAETIARLKLELATVQQQARFDRGQLRLLERDLALAQARARARVLVAAPTPVAVAKPSPSAPVADETAVPVARETAAPEAPNDALVAALRSDKVYAIDGAVDGEPWHLTILQPREGERAVVYSGTPGAPAGQTYRTWVLRDGRTVDAGELVPGKPATLEMPMALEPGDVVAFSREPIGTGDLPTQPFLMQLKIQ